MAMVSVGAMMTFVVVAARRVGYPYELQWFEGSTVEVSARVTEGLPLYGPPTTEFTPWPYPPLYFWVTGELAKVTGVSLTTLRVVSLAATLAAVLLIILIIRRVTGSMLAATVSAGLFVATYQVSGDWFDAARIDSLFLALSLGAILAGLRSRTWRGGLAAGALFLAAFLTKQNALLIAGPLLLWLLIRRRPVGLAASVVLAVGSVGSVVVGDLLTDGWYSPYVVTQLLGQGIALQWVLGYWVADVILPFAVVLGTLGWWTVHHRGWLRLDADRTYLIAAVTGLMLASWAGRLHDGGYVNNAIPGHAGTAMLLGLAAAAVLSSSPSRRLLVGSAAVIAAQAIVMSLWHGSPLPTAADQTAGDAFIAAVRTLPQRTVLPTHPYYLRLAGRPTHASAIAIGDLLDTRPGRARDAISAQLPWSLAGVDSVVLDSADGAALFGSALTRDFTLVTSSLVPGQAFYPASDVATRPALLYIRTTVLNR